MEMGEDLYFVVFFEEGQWVAIGLQHEIAVQGPTLQELKRRVELTLKAYRDVSGLQSLFNLPPAPAEYWERFIQAYKNGFNVESAIEEDLREKTSLGFLELKAA